MDEQFFMWSLDDDEARGIDVGVIDVDAFVPSFSLLDNVAAEPKQEKQEQKAEDEDDQDKYLDVNVISLESDDDEEEEGEEEEGKPLVSPVEGQEANPPALTEEAIAAALARFGHTELRGLQEPALRSVFEGKDTVVLLPTGGGKSLCFQLPAVLMRGLVIVISPLLALMQDQVIALRKRKIRVEMLCSLVSMKDKRKIHDRLQRDAEFRQSKDRIEILYTTPETLRTYALQCILRKMARRKALALFAIDEAHCISSWGHDFRPAYLQLSSLRDTFPDVPIMALTATATERVREDIHKELQLRPDTTVLTGDFNRPNISYTARNKDEFGDATQALVDYIKRCHPGSVGIVYVHRRLDTEELVEGLMERDETIRAAPYHASIPLKQREKTLIDWLHGKIDIICATIAFGMGIDHPSVRFVVHWNMPKSLENLYQESGRAGRDGHPSHHVLLYSYEDYENFKDLLALAEEDVRERAARGQKVNRSRVKTLEEKLKMLKKVMEWATGIKCRRQRVLEYFGQRISLAQCNGTCDFCNSSLEFERLPRLVSHRPEAFTFHGRIEDSPPPRRRKRRAPESEPAAAREPPARRDAVRQQPVLDQQDARERLAHQLIDAALEEKWPIPQAARQPPVDPIFQRRPPPAPLPRANRFQAQIPAGVRTIRDYIVATERERTAFLRPWEDPNHFNWRPGEDEVLGVDSDSEDDDVQWVKTEATGHAAPHPAASVPAASLRGRPAKRRRSSEATSEASEVIVIDSD